MRGVDDAVDQSALHDEAQGEEGGRAQGKTRVGIEPEARGEQEGQVHAPDHHVAVGEVDHAHDAEDQGQAHRHEAVDASEQEAVEKALGDQHEVHGLSGTLYSKGGFAALPKPPPKDSRCAGKAGARSGEIYFFTGKTYRVCAASRGHTT